MKNIKEVKTFAAQGDVLFIQVDAIPDEYKPTESKIVTHSETGHNHEIEGEARMLERLDADPLVCYLRVEGAYADIVHRRSFDTHATIRLPHGDWMVKRQREYTPEGWRRVED